MVSFPGASSSNCISATPPLYLLCTYEVIINIMAYLVIVYLAISMQALGTPLQSESEGRVAQQDDLAPISFSILPLEVDGQEQNRDDNQNIASHTRRESGYVARSVLGAEDQGSRDSTNTANPS